MFIHNFLIYVLINTHTRTHAHTHTQVHTNRRNQTDTHTNAHTHTDTHTYKHIHTLTPTLSLTQVNNDTKSSMNNEQLDTLESSVLQYDPMLILNVNLDLPLVDTDN